MTIQIFLNMQYHWLLGDTDFVSKLCGQYPAIYLHFKDCQGDNWDEMLQRIWDSICEMVRPHAGLLKKELQLYEEQARFDFLEPLVRPYAGYKMALEYFAPKTGKRVVFLVDEYDAPLNCAFRCGFYKEASNFFRPLLLKSLKREQFTFQSLLDGNRGTKRRRNSV
jgi:hypothetical protein